MFNVQDASFLSGFLFICRIYPLLYQCLTLSSPSDIFRHIYSYYRSWANEPNNIAGQEHCVMLYNNGGFADKNCNLTARYICNTPAVGTLNRKKYR